MRSFYSSKLRLSDPKNCKYNDKDLVANFHKDGTIYVLKKGKMFFDGTCKDLMANLHYVVPANKRFNFLEKIFSISGKYEIRFADKNKSGQCVVSYKSGM